MSSLQPIRPAAVVASPRTTRQIAKLSDATEIAVAQTQAVAEVESAKLDALQQIAGRAMQGVALVGQLEQQLAQVVPIAASRLQAIGDIHALTTAGIVSSAPRRLR